MKTVFFSYSSTEVYFNIDDVGIYAVNGCAEHFSKHWRVNASVTPKPFIPNNKLLTLRLRK